MAKLKWDKFPMPCLVCGVDSGPIKIFLGCFIGSLVLATLSFWIWAKFKEPDQESQAARMAIDSDKRE